MREAMERGEFDDLPGQGKPLDLSDRDPDWWVKGLLEREQIRMPLPTSLALRREASEIDETVADCRDEAAVRAVVDDLNERILAGCEEVIRKHNLPGYPVGIGSKGMVTFSTAKIVDYESFKANQDADLSELAWLFNMNRGIFMTPGREEEWTLSVTHQDADVDHYVAVFDEMAAELTA